MIIKETLKKYHKIEIELLLAHVLKKPKEFLFLHPEFILTSKHLNILTSLVKRRLKGEPMAYILGYKDFYGLRFKVNRNVLIPRPETEWMADKAIERFEDLKIEKLKKQIKILDLGTGSGCIIISLAKALSAKHLALSTKFYASDISKKALGVARSNAKKHRAGIKFIQSNLFDGIKSKFDVIIANLPYVPKKDYEAGIRNLGWEPKTALTDGTNLFKIYHKFFRQLPHHIAPNAVVLLEIDPKAKPYLIKWAKKYLPRGDMRFYRDFNGLWRYAILRYP